MRFVVASLAACLLALVGCAQPSTVDGVVGGSAYSIRDESPELRPGHDRLLVVLSEEAGETLRVVTLSLPPLERLPDEGELVVGEDVEIKAAFGQKTEMIRSDGVRVVSTAEAVIPEAVEGTVFLETKEPLLSGTFEATLEDGGRIEGAFVVAPR